MNSRIPPVSKYMSPSPHTIGVDQTMAQAHRVMRENRIRHLPVLQGGKLVGIVSAGDLHLIETLQDVDPDEVVVEDAMTANPHSVAPDAPLDDVVSVMAEHKYGCVVVMERQHVVGIFTTVDACRAFAEWLRTG
jgi:acetoin utilization protein AcuB